MVEIKIPTNLTSCIRPRPGGRTPSGVYLGALGEDVAITLVGFIRTGSGGIENEVWVHTRVRGLQRICDRTRAGKGSLVLGRELDQPDTNIGSVVAQKDTNICILEIIVKGGRSLIVSCASRYDLRVLRSVVTKRERCFAAGAVRKREKAGLC